MALSPFRSSDFLSVSCPFPRAPGGKLLLALLVLCPFLRLRGETSVEINGFSGSNFSLAAEQTFSEKRTSPLGSYQFTAYSYSGGASRQNGKVTLQLPTANGGFGSLQLSHVFDQPVDLSTVDYIGVDFTHGLAYNPVSSILIYLENGSALEIANTTLAPLLPGQKKFPIYDLKSQSGYTRVHPSRVKSVHVIISCSSSTAMAVAFDALRVVTIAPKPPVSLSMTLGGIRDVVVTTNRPMGTNEIYRLEASHNLVTWFDKGSKVRGDGNAPVFEKFFNDARFYRMSYYNYVDISAP